MKTQSKAREQGNFKEGANVETVEANYIEGVLKGLIRKYYQERMDNVVLAFGKAGDRIVRNIKPLQIRKTSYRSVQIKEERAFAQNVTSPDDTELNLMEPDPVKVTLLSREEYEYRKALNQFDQWDEPLESASIATTYMGGAGDWESLSKELINEVDKSNSYVLISGFGGSFAQSMHVRFSKLLTKRKIAHINVIVKPSKEDMKRRKLAEAGIKELEETGASLIIYDNQKLIEKQKAYSVDKNKAIRKINIDIARHIEVLSARLSNTSELLKYQLTA